MKALHITGTSVTLVFSNEDDRDKAHAAFSSVTPREIHSRAKIGGGAEGDSTLTIRLQDITHPVTIGLEDSAPAPAAPEVSTGTPTFQRFLGRSPEDVAGVNAESRVNEKPILGTDFNPTANLPGAVNHDPATVTNAGYEGSPGQAIQSAIGNGPATATPGGFAGPDKAQKVEGAASGVAVPSISVEKLHPEGQEQDETAIRVSEQAVKDEADAKAAERDKLENKAASEAEESKEKAEDSAKAANAAAGATP